MNVVQSFQAAEDGDAVTYIGEPPGSEGTGETGPGGGDQWLATRTSQGWKTGAITPASTTATAQFQVYQGFTPNLTIGFLEGGALQPAQPLGTATPEKSCRSLYTHELPPAAGAFDALFVKGDGAEYEPCGHPLFAGASSDSSQVIFQSEAPLTENAVEATEVPATREGPHQGHLGAPQESGEPCEFGCNLYDSVAGHLDLVNVLEGKTVPNATFGGYPDEAPTESTGFSNAISADGSRIFWTDTREKLPSSGEPDPDFEHVFVLENDTSKSV